MTVVMWCQIFERKSVPPSNEFPGHRMTDFGTRLIKEIFNILSGQKPYSIVFIRRTVRGQSQWVETVVSSAWGTVRHF